VFTRHLALIRSSLVRLWHRPRAAFLTLAVMTLALSLPLGLWLTLNNLERLPNAVERSRSIELFLKPEINYVHAEVLSRQLQAWDDVATVEHRTPEQGLAELEAQGLQKTNELLRGETPLPHLLRVIPLGDDAQLVAALEALPEVDLMQHDARWRRQVDGWLNFGNRLIWILGALFGSGCVLVVGNTVRLDFLSRREEMSVLQLLGASNGFIRQPFVYLGLWHGLLAGIAAIGLLALAEEALRAPLAALVSGYNSRFALQGFSLLEILIVLAASTALGGLGATLVSTHLLRQSETGR